MALCVKFTIEHVGMMETDPIGVQLPNHPPPHPHELGQQHAEPIGHVGAIPAEQRSLIALQSTLRRTPVNPHPDTPPLLVKTVTV